jgi:hypothetical protein
MLTKIITQLVRKQKEKLSNEELFAQGYSPFVSKYLICDNSNPNFSYNWDFSDQDEVRSSKIITCQTCHLRGNKWRLEWDYIPKPGGKVKKVGFMRLDFEKIDFQIPKYYCPGKWNSRHEKIEELHAECEEIRDGFSISRGRDKYGRDVYSQITWEEKDQFTAPLIKKIAELRLYLFEKIGDDIDLSDTFD